jgi:HSP20 family protein
MITPYHIFIRDMQRMQREMNHAFRRYANECEPYSGSFPAINLSGDKEQLTLTAELPGLGVDDIDISLNNNVLTISGERKLDQLPEGAQIHRNERTCGKFQRMVELPYRIDSNKVKAVFQKGILSLTMERAEQDKAHRIQIKTE